MRHRSTQLRRRPPRPDGRRFDQTHPERQTRRPNPPANPETGHQAAKTVTAVWAHQDDLVNLQLHADSDNNGKPDHITTTDDHLFWNATDDKWQDAQDLDPGDALLAADGYRVPGAGILWTSPHREAAYNLTIADLHTYHVVGQLSVLVHNIGDAQFGMKWGKHARDYGLDPSNPAHRTTFVEGIQNVYSGPHEVRVGQQGWPERLHHVPTRGRLADHDG